VPLLMGPNGAEGMREIARHGVRIDLCPKCRGVWPDRGEGENRLEAAVGVGDDAVPPGPAAPGFTPPLGHPAASGHPCPDPGHHPNTRPSLLREIFDFAIFD